MIDTVNTYHKAGFCASKDRLTFQISDHGNSYNTVALIDFTEEIAYLMNNSFNLNAKETSREIAARKNYYKLSTLALFLKWDVF